MNENQKLFAEALRLYVNNSLLNDMGWDPFKAIAEGKLPTVKLGLVNGYLTITEVECADVASLEKELKEAKKTIKQLESQIEELKPKEETPTAEETLLIAKAPMAGGVAPKATQKRTTRKRLT
jgi:ABC-type enterochelin transport system substrate-binding protein